MDEPTFRLLVVAGILGALVVLGGLVSGRVAKIPDPKERQKTQDFLQSLASVPRLLWLGMFFWVTWVVFFTD